jgi:hypothetical protein
LPGASGNREAEIGRIARDVPVAQAAFGVQPLAQLGLDPGHRHVAGQPVAQEGSKRPTWKKKCSESRSSGVAPDTTERGFFSSVGA